MDLLGQCWHSATGIFPNFSLFALARGTLDSVSPRTTLFLSQSSSGRPRGGNPTHLRLRGTPSEPPNKQQYAQINSFSLLPNIWLAWGNLDPVSPPTTLFLSQSNSAGPWREIPPICDPRGPHQSLQTTSNTPKRQDITKIRQWRKRRPTANSNE